MPCFCSDSRPFCLSLAMFACKLIAEHIMYTKRNAFVDVIPQRGRFFKPFVESNSFAPINMSSSFRQYIYEMPKQSCINFARFASWICRCMLFLVYVFDRTMLSLAVPNKCFIGFKGQACMLNLIHLKTTRTLIFFSSV